MGCGRAAADMALRDTPRTRGPTCLQLLRLSILSLSEILRGLVTTVSPVTSLLADNRYSCCVLQDLFYCVVTACKLTLRTAMEYTQHRVSGVHQTLRLLVNLFFYHLDIH